MLRLSKAKIIQYCFNFWEHTLTGRFFKKIFITLLVIPLIQRFKTADVLILNIKNIKKKYYLINNNVYWKETCGFICLIKFTSNVTIHYMRTIERNANRAVKVECDAWGSNKLLSTSCYEFNREPFTYPQTNCTFFI